MGGKPTGTLLELIGRDFPSYEAWLEDFKASGMAARGWAWLAYDHDWHLLTTAVGDAQNTFPYWNATPILALDVYEHAYWIDYGRARGKYIEAFFNNLDWNVVAQNLERALAMQSAHR
jgi:Fe-Mn family superoxide dismutase